MSAECPIAPEIQSVKPAIIDDRGRPVVLLNWLRTKWPESDVRLKAVRVRLFALRSLPMPRWQRTTYLILLSLAVLLLPFGFVFFDVLLLFAILVAFVFGGVIVSDIIRDLIGHHRLRQQQASVLVEAGLCASCGYNLVGLVGQDDGCIECPECGAAWTAERILHAAPFVEDSRERDYFARSVEEFFDLDRMPGKDDRGHSTMLMPRRLWSARRHAATDKHRHRLLLASHELRRTGFALRLAIATAIVLISLMVMYAGRHTLEDGAAKIFIVCVIAFGGFIMITKIGCPPRKFIAIMKRAGACPSCGTELSRALRGPDGLYLCAVCRAAWELDADAADRQNVTASARNIEPVSAVSRG